MSISPRFMEELRTRLTLSDIIGRKVRLTRAGREFKACCPFHNEKTPSFYVNDDKQFYHCFGCGAHGDVVGFMMQHDNMSFIEAVEALANEAGMEVPKSSPQEVERAKKKKGLHSLLEDATRWMEKQLRDPSNVEAYRYMIERGHTDEALNNFRVGFAPNDGQAIRKAMLALEYSDKDMIEAGILRPGKQGREPYAFFRDRIIFPVPDRRGRVVAYGGRILPDHLRVPDRSDYTPAKYMNSSDTPLFHKGSMLYGEPRARQAAADGQSLIVVEGYVDVMACVKAGYNGALAPLGTALTEEQILVLWKMIPQERKEPILCFDGDNAGRRAAMRAVERILPLLKPNQSAKIAFLPEGQDPDSLINGAGKQAFDSIIESAMSLVDFIWMSETSGKNFQTPEARAGLAKTLEQKALMISDRDIQYYYKQSFRDKTYQAFGGKVQKGKFPQRQDRNAHNQGIVSIKRPRFTSPENKLVAAMINHPHIFDRYEEEFGLLPIGNARVDAMRQEIISIMLEQPKTETSDLINNLKEKGYQTELKNILSHELYALARFSRPTAEEEEVLEGWQKAYEMLSGAAQPDDMSKIS
ncbi:MAG: DNA primase [Pseudomonadota bacterium]